MHGWKLINGGAGPFSHRGWANTTLMVNMGSNIHSQLYAHSSFSLPNKSVLYTYSVARACCRNRHGRLTTCPATLATDRNAHSLFLLPLPPLINFPNVLPPLSQNQSCRVQERASARSRHSLPYYLISGGQGPCCTLLSDLRRVVTNQTEQNIGS